MKNKKGKIIKDTIYGDIYFPESLVKLIDTPEMQRLHRIKQLSTSYQTFPDATHSRFAHSIGTYNVMRKLLVHFDEIFQSMGEGINEEHKNLAYCAALLHDIGHGPFSHAFEHAFPEEIAIDNHEKWSVNIIKTKDTGVNKVLREEFGESFPEKISCIIEKNFDTIFKDWNVQELNIFKVISLLISSQLDADRMDYLLRDSYFTAVTNGNYDLERLISSLSLDTKDNNIVVCVDEKYISTLEQYILARYHMYKEVYYHPFKCEMETVVQKIFYRLYELYCIGDEKYINALPSAFKTIFSNNELTASEYTSLDDNIIVAMISKLTNCGDYILCTLSRAFLNREKYDKLSLLNNKKSDIEFFKEKFNEAIAEEGMEKINDYSKEYFWIDSEIKVETYKKEEDIGKNILIRKKDGTLANISDISDIIRSSKADKNINGENKQMVAFLNKDLLAYKYKCMTLKTENLIKSFQNRNHIEIEKKYIVEDVNIDDIIKFINKIDSCYKISPLSDKLQTDLYFDTNDKLLYNTNKTLRIRLVNEDKIITIKKPVKDEDLSNSQRFEFEENTKSDKIVANKDFILKHLPELNDYIEDKSLDNSIIIKNQRKKYLIEKNEIRFELAADNVKYFKSNDDYNPIKQENEIEIELKSDYTHRICLDELTSQLEKNLNIKPSSESKYKRGLNYIGF